MGNGEDPSADFVGTSLVRLWRIAGRDRKEPLRSARGGPSVGKWWLVSGRPVGRRGERRVEGVSLGVHVGLMLEGLYVVGAGGSVLAGLEIV